MDGGDQDRRGWGSMVEFKIEEWSMCTHKSTNRTQVDFSYKTKGLIKHFSFICKIEKGLYVCTLSELEEWGILFDYKGTCSFNQIMNLE